MSKQTSLLRGATDSIKTVDRILNERGDLPLDWHAIRTAASQAQQAAAELWELLGYMQGVERSGK